MASPLRILMVLNAPWDRRLGGPRVHVELAEQFRKLGHEVDAFTWTDAFPSPALLPQLEGFTRSFALKTTAWLRVHGRRYDIVDARAGSVIASKRRLGFDGLLVTRSTGLLPVYEREFLSWERRSFPDARARLVSRGPRRVQRTFQERRARLSFEHCDLLNVVNSDEQAFARDELGIGEKTVKFLHGLTRERARAFAAARAPSERRLERPVVAFVGSWSRRKGCTDMSTIIGAIRRRVPATRFRLLGTGASPPAVIAECGSVAGIEVVPNFESEQLPGLLGDVAVGILPSYVEGFPFSVIEMLAAGAPVVAYDAPGARETIPSVDPSLLVRRGDARSFGGRVADLLELGPEAHQRLSSASAALADRLRWEEIASQTLDCYRWHLERLRSRPIARSARGGYRMTRPRDAPDA